MEVHVVSDEILIYQFKITLRGVSPPIWRRIQVPQNDSFRDLHVALQDAMGWFDCHLHVFRVFNVIVALFTP
ncbi:MAG: plasmid pRiA4b ORF-3 family protein [bacterium]